MFCSWCWGGGGGRGLGLLQPRWLWCKYQGIMSVWRLADTSALPALILPGAGRGGETTSLFQPDSLWTHHGCGASPHTWRQDGKVLPKARVSGPAASFEGHMNKRPCFSPTSDVKVELRSSDCCRPSLMSSWMEENTDVISGSR